MRVLTISNHQLRDGGIAYLREKRMGGRGGLVLKSLLELDGVHPMVYSILGPRKEEFQPSCQLPFLTSRIEAYQFSKTSHDCPSRTHDSR